LFWPYWNKNKKSPSQKNFHKNKNQKKPPIKLKKTKIWRRGWDSNPRGAKAPLALKASAVYRKRKTTKEKIKTLILLIYPLCYPGRSKTAFKRL
jgi:hypothetical protein